MTRTHRSHDDATAEMFRKDPSLAADYLNDVLATDDEVDLMMALRSLSTAFGGVQEQGNPSLKMLRAVLNSMGLRLTVRPITTSEA